jgi:hypothetical protein
MSVSPEAVGVTTIALTYNPFFLLGDEEKPICWRCRIGGRNCRRPNNSESQPARPRRTSIYEKAFQRASPGTNSPAQLSILHDLRDNADPSPIVAAPPAQSVSSSPDSGVTGIPTTPSTVVSNATVPTSLAGGAAPPGEADLAASAHFDIQTLQGIQLHLDHSDIRAISPTIQSSIIPFAVSTEEETLLQHYTRHLAKWVSNTRFYID